MMGYVFVLFLVMCYFSSHMDKPECLIAAALFYIGTRVRYTHIKLDGFGIINEKDVKDETEK